MLLNFVHGVFARFKGGVLTALAMRAVRAGRHEDAVRYFEGMPAEWRWSPHCYPLHEMLAKSYRELDREEDAKAEEKLARQLRQKIPSR
jgi:hypothetical protein